MIRKSYRHHRLVYPSILSGLLFCLLVLATTVSAQSLAYPVKTINGKKYYEYTVQPKEGFYRLKVKFNIHEDEIIMHNPQAKQGLKEGMKLLIPVFENNTEVKTSPSQKSNGTTDSKPAVTSNEPKFIEHIVEKKQTMFRIRRMYDISEEDLLAYNPQLKGRSLREGDILKIPVKPEVAETKDTKKTKQSDQQIVKQKENPAEEVTTPPVRVHKQHFRIAFLLPFMLDQKNETSDSRFVEFYSGALLAINNAKTKGRTIEVFTFDTEKSDLKVMELLNDTVFKSIDLIVGPAYSNQVSLVCDFARTNQIPTLIPFTSRIYDLESNEYIYQFNPGQEVELTKLTDLLSQESQRSQLLFIENPHVALNDEGNQLASQLKVLLKNNRTDFKLLEADPSNTRAIHSQLSRSKENIVIFNTNRINTLSAQLRQLIQLSDSFKIKIYEPYAWKTAKADKPSSFYMSVFRNEFPEKTYEEYMQHFGEVFGWLPTTEYPRYDLLGFDLLNYYFSVADLPSSTRKATPPLFEGIQSTIRFEKTSERGGYLNKQLNHYE